MDEGYDFNNGLAGCSVRVLQLTPAHGNFNLEFKLQADRLFAGESLTG